MSAITASKAGRLPCTSESRAMCIRGVPSTVSGEMEASGTGERTRLPLAIGVVVVAAGAATFLLWPRNGVIEPAAVDAKSSFTSAQLDRAEDFRSVQRSIGAGGLVLSTGTLA